MAGRQEAFTMQLVEHVRTSAAMNEQPENRPAGVGAVMNRLAEKLELIRQERSNDSR
jgi:hypothetical protein